VTLLVLAILLGFMVSRPLWVPPPARVALVGLVALAVLSFASSGYAESSDSAYVEAHRWALYAALLTVGLYLGREGLGAERLLAAVMAGVAAVALMIVVRLAGEDTSLFFDARLTEPLGYVNGNGAALLLGIFPFVLTAATGRRLGVRGLCAALATMLACLVVLVESRGALLSLVMAAVVVLVLARNRMRMLWLMTIITAAVIAAEPELGSVYNDAHGATREAGAAAVGSAGAAVALAAFAAAVVWSASELIGGRISASGRRLIGRVAAAVAALILMACVVVALANISVIGNWTDRQWQAFSSNESPNSSPTRLFSGAGNRYDYWRVAVEEFAAHPVPGVGAGNYVTEYFRRRQTTEDIRQPHSLPLQTVAELGVVGGTCLAVFLFGVCWILVQGLRGPRRDLAVAVAGMFTAWLAQTSVDWIHLLPGVTGAVLLSLAAVASGATGVRGRRPPPRVSRRLLIVGLGAVAVLVTTVGVARLSVASHYRTVAATALRTGSPNGAIRGADSALALEPGLLPAIYIRSAALARMNRYQAARNELLAAVAREPHNPVPHALLGDLAVRRTDFAQAHRDYAAAARLDPRNAELRALTRDPGSARAGATP
jgi:O-antigen ligase